MMAGPNAANGHEAQNDNLPSLQRPGNITVAYMRDEDDSPMSPRINTPNPFSRKNSALDLDDYFVRWPLRVLYVFKC